MPVKKALKARSCVTLGVCDQVVLKIVEIN